MSLDAVDIRIRFGSVDDGDRVSTEDLKATVAGENCGGIFVDAYAEQAGIRSDHHHESAEAVALTEVLVDNGAGHQSESGNHLCHAHLWCVAARAERHHMRREDRCASTCPRDHGGLETALQYGVHCSRAANDGREPHLVAARHEDAGGLLNHVCDGI